MREYMSNTLCPNEFNDWCKVGEEVQKIKLISMRKALVQKYLHKESNITLLVVTWVNDYSVPQYKSFIKVNSKVPLDSEKEIQIFLEAYKSGYERAKLDYDKVSDDELKLIQAFRVVVDSYFEMD